MNAEKKKQLLDELTFQTSRSGGKGGQNVNKTETKVELIFSVSDSNALSDPEKELIQRKLKNRINDSGELKICSSQHRTQGMNKQHVIDKFLDKIKLALLPEKKRVATVIPAAVKELIRRNKKVVSEKKAWRKQRTRDFL
ncbi:MAG: aminoacyl-tRNA hydrolase [Bacteroidetes bacterium]|nr:aminoacyl-tRNA hydrolase [Bacteroidota bacterium]